MTLHRLAVWDACEINENTEEKEGSKLDQSYCINELLFN